mgnify:CR=1 FL=1
MNGFDIRDMGREELGHPAMIDVRKLRCDVHRWKPFSNKALILLKALGNQEVAP